MSATFTSTGHSESGHVLRGQGVRIEITGAFVATLQVMRLITGNPSDESVVETITAPGVFESDIPGIYRLRCSSFTSGTVRYSLVVDPADEDVGGAEVLPFSGTVAQLQAAHPAATNIGNLAYTTDAELQVSDGSSWKRPATAIIDDVTTLRLTRCRAALARVRAGTGRARVVLFGDSTTAGSGAGTSGTDNAVGAWPFSSPNALAARLALLGVPTSSKSFVSDQNITATGVTLVSYDTRITLGANWSLPASGAYTTLCGQLIAYTAGAVNNLTFTPAGNTDTLTIYYVRSGVNGGLNVNVNGGSTLATVATAGAQAVLSATVTAPRDANQWRIVPLNDGEIFIVAAVAYDSTVSAVDIIQGGCCGAVAATFNDTASVWAAGNNRNLFQQDLAIVRLTENDSVLGTTVATYVSALTTLITSLLTQGDVIVEAGTPNGTATVAANETYVNLARSVASNLDVPFLDLNARWGNYTTANTMGRMFNANHPNTAGYQDVARAEASMLARA